MEPTRNKLERILRAKSPFTEDQIAALSDKDGWEWLYRNKPGETRPDKGQQICFTGFGLAECEELKAITAASGWLHQVNSVTVSLNYLCVGPNAGPAKLEKARKRGVTLLSRDQFDDLIAHGEVP